MNINKKFKVPVILYEQDKDGKSNILPYIEVGKEEEMPPILFISEYKETGEYEADPHFGSRPIVDMLIHKYVDLDILSKKLDEKTFDKIRLALGMQPLKVAQKSGQKILDKIVLNAENNKLELETNPEAKMKRTFSIGEDLKQKMKNILEENKK